MFLSVLYTLFHIIKSLLILGLPMILIIGVPILFIVWYFKKGKKGILKAVTATVTAFAVVAIAFNLLFPTAFPYVDWWIYGKTQAEVTEIYKEDEFGGRFVGNSYYYIPYPFWNQYYCIDYDSYEEDGKAYYIHTSDSTP